MREHRWQRKTRRFVLAQKNITDTGAFREYIGRDDRHKRGDRPNYSGTVVTLESVRGNKAFDSQGKEHSLTTIKPVDPDARTERITVRLRGSTQTDARQRGSLAPFAEALREHMQSRGGSRLILGQAAAWLKRGERKAQFEVAMRGVKSFSSFLKLFPDVFKIDIPVAGGTTRVALV